MRDRIESPMALAVVRWRSQGEGGRASGPPTAAVYVSTCVFPLGGEDQVQPEWPAAADPALSILLEEVETLDHLFARRYKVGFLAPDLARPFVRPGAEVIVMEGPRIVGIGCFEQVFDKQVP